MPAAVSSIKPDNSKFKRPDPGIQWNNRTEESWAKNGLSVEQFRFTQEKQFLSIVDTRKCPGEKIERTVTKIVRIKAIDWSTEKRERKEYIYYMEDWEGRDWLGTRIAPVTDHLEGVYEEALIEPVFNENSPEPVRYQYAGKRTAYYIPFSKKKVDDIIAKSAKSGVEGIQYVVKFSPQDCAPGQMRYGQRTEFSYEQFATYTFADLYKIATKPWANQNPNYDPKMSSYK